MSSTARHIENMSQAEHEYWEELVERKEHPERFRCKSTAVFVKMDPQPPEGAKLLCRDAGGWWFDDGTEDGWLMPPPHWPGDTVREREEWFKVSVYETIPQGSGYVAVVRYRDGVEREIGVGLTTVGELIATHDWQPAETMPAWAIRPRVVKSVEPVMRDGVWWWRLGV